MYPFLQILRMYLDNNFEEFSTSNKILDIVFDKSLKRSHKVTYLLYSPKFAMS